MKNAALKNIIPLLFFIIPVIFFGACDTDDVVIDGKGINADSTLLYINAAEGSRNSFVLSTLYPWEVDFLYEKDKEWLAVSPLEGESGTTITVTGKANEYRRRSGYLVFDNGMYTFTVHVIQRAPAIYEPGTVTLSENFGMTEIEGRTVVSSYVSWGKTGTGSSSASYSGSNAVVQAAVNSVSDPTRPTDDVLRGLAYPEATGGNNVEIASGGDFTVSRIGVNTTDRFILTLYIAARQDGNYITDPEKSLGITGGNLEDYLFDIPFEVVELSEDRGWKKIVAEFKKVEGAAAFYLQFTNNGSLPLYIDDILLEAAGKSETVVGTYVPTVTTLAAQDVTATSATIRGQYTLPAQITSVDEFGLEYRLNTDADYTSVTGGNGFTVENIENGKSFRFVINGADGDIYFYRAYAIVNDIKTEGASLELILADPEEEEGED